MQLSWPWLRFVPRRLNLKRLQQEQQPHYDQCSFEVACNKTGLIETVKYLQIWSRSQRDEASNLFAFTLLKLRDKNCVSGRAAR